MGFRSNGQREDQILRQLLKYMHNHSDKVEPKKVAITVVLLILLLGYAYATRNDRNSTKKAVQESPATTTLITN